MAMRHVGSDVIDSIGKLIFDEAEARSKNKQELTVGMGGIAFTGTLRLGWESYDSKGVRLVDIESHAREAFRFHRTVDHTCWLWSYTLQSEEFRAGFAKVGAGKSEAMPT